MKSYILLLILFLFTLLLAIQVDRAISRTLPKYNPGYFIALCDTDTDPSCVIWNNRDAETKCDALCKNQNGTYAGKFKSNSLKTHHECLCRVKV